MVAPSRTKLGTGYLGSLHFGSVYDQDKYYLFSLSQFVPFRGQSGLPIESSGYLDNGNSR